MLGSLPNRVIYHCLHKSSYWNALSQSVINYGKYACSIIEYNTWSINL